MLSPALPQPPGTYDARRDLVEVLRELGYGEGRNLVVERRYADGRAEQLPALAADLVGRLDRAKLERTARECLTDWQGLLAGQPVQARQMLKKLLEGRLVFTPMGDGTVVEFRGTGVLDPVLSGIVGGDGIPKAGGSR
jgi:hypothetical protein